MGAIPREKDTCQDGALSAGVRGPRCISGRGSSSPSRTKTLDRAACCGARKATLSLSPDDAGNWWQVDGKDLACFLGFRRPADAGSSAPGIRQEVGELSG